MTGSSDQSSELKFWTGGFGNSYIDRNAAIAEHLRARVSLWAKILNGMAGAPPQSILEVGSNIGNNLRALRTLTGAELHALEPNRQARETLVQDGVVPADNVLEGMAAQIGLGDASVDLVFTSGVLIHIHPEDLLAACTEMHRVARRYIACIEYFSDKMETIPYRGHNDKLFKRDFGGFWLDNFPKLKVLDYGFAWKRLTGLDNLTWWLFEKQS